MLRYNLYMAIIFVYLLPYLQREFEYLIPLLQTIFYLFSMNSSQHRSNKSNKQVNAVTSAEHSSKGQNNVNQRVTSDSKVQKYVVYDENKSGSKIQVTVEENSVKRVIKLNSLKKNPVDSHNFTFDEKEDDSKRGNEPFQVKKTKTISDYLTDENDYVTPSDRHHIFQDQSPKKPHHQIMETDELNDEVSEMNERQKIQEVVHPKLSWNQLLERQTSLPDKGSKEPYDLPVPIQEYFNEDERQKYEKEQQERTQLSQPFVFDDTQRRITDYLKNSQKAPNQNVHDEYQVIVKEPTPQKSSKYKGSTFLKNNDIYGVQEQLNQGQKLQSNKLQIDELQRIFNIQGHSPLVPHQQLGKQDLQIENIRQRSPRQRVIPSNEEERSGQYNTTQNNENKFQFSGNNIRIKNKGSEVLSCQQNKQQKLVDEDIQNFTSFKPNNVNDANQFSSKNQVTFYYHRLGNAIYTQDCFNDLLSHKNKKAFLCGSSFEIIDKEESTIHELPKDGNNIQLNEDSQYQISNHISNQYQRKQSQQNQATIKRELPHSSVVKTIYYRTQQELNALIKYLKLNQELSLSDDTQKSQKDSKKLTKNEKERPKNQNEEAISEPQMKKQSKEKNDCEKIVVGLKKTKSKISESKRSNADKQVIKKTLSNDSQKRNEKVNYIIRKSQKDQELNQKLEEDLADQFQECQKQQEKPITTQIVQPTDQSIINKSRKSKQIMKEGYIKKGRIDQTSQQEMKKPADKFISFIESQKLKPSQNTVKSGISRQTTKKNQTKKVSFNTQERKQKSIVSSREKQKESSASKRKNIQFNQNPIGSVFHFQLIPEKHNRNIDNERMTLMQVRRSGRLYSKSKSKREQRLSHQDQEIQADRRSTSNLKGNLTSQEKSRRKRKSISGIQSGINKPTASKKDKLEDQQVTIDWLMQHISQLKKIVIENALMYDDFKAMTQTDLQVTNFLLDLQEKAAQIDNKEEKIDKHKKGPKQTQDRAKIGHFEGEYIQNQLMKKITRTGSKSKRKIISPGKSVRTKPVSLLNTFQLEKKEEEIKSKKLSQNKTSSQANQHSLDQQQHESYQQPYNLIQQLQQPRQQESEQQLREKQKMNQGDSIAHRIKIFHQNKKKYRIPEYLPLTVQKVVNPDILNLGIYALIKLGKVTQFELGTKYAITPICQLRFARRSNVKKALNESKKLVPKQYQQNIAFITLNSTLLNLINKQTEERKNNPNNNNIDDANEHENEKVNPQISNENKEGQQVNDEIQFKERAKSQTESVKYQI